MVQPFEILENEYMRNFLNNLIRKNLYTNSADSRFSKVDLVNLVKPTLFGLAKKK